MAHTVRKNRIWVIGVFVLIAVCGVFLGWQRIYAQTPVEAPPPGTPGAVSGVPDMGMGAAGGTAAAAPATAVVTEPAVSFGQVVHSGIGVSSKKNWDGRVFSNLKFKYKTLDGRTLTVVLPSEYKAEKRTKTGWETLFVVYAMDVEIAQDAIERSLPPDVSAFMGQLMAQIRGQAGNRPAPEIIQAAIEKTKTYLPATGMGSINMPIMLPGMP